MKKDSYKHPLGMIFSIDHQESLSWFCTSDIEICLQYWNEIGGSLVVENTYLASLLGIKANTKKLIKEVLRSWDREEGIVISVEVTNPTVGPRRVYFCNGFSYDGEDYWCTLSGHNFLYFDKERFIRIFPTETLQSREYSDQGESNGRLL